MKSSWCHLHFQVPLWASLSHRPERRTLFFFFFYFILICPIDASKIFKASHSWLQFYKNQTLKRKKKRHLYFGTKFKSTKLSLHLTKQRAPRVSASDSSPSSSLSNPSGGCSQRKSTSPATGGEAKHAAEIPPQYLLQRNQGGIHQTVSLHTRSSRQLQSNPATWITWLSMQWHTLLLKFVNPVSSYYYVVKNILGLLNSYRHWEQKAYTNQPVLQMWFSWKLTDLQQFLKTCMFENFFSKWHVLA